jgi:acyl-coenzyme A synthetase/AMP-(fatty) acid ligase
MARDFETDPEFQSKLARPLGLAAFKALVRVAFWPETLPRDANGKIMKSDLKTVFVGDVVA